jgi:hypothetical protein
MRAYPNPKVTAEKDGSQWKKIEGILSSEKNSMIICASRSQF